MNGSFLDGPARRSNRGTPRDEEERLVEQGKAYLATIQGADRTVATRLGAPRARNGFDQMAERLDTDWFGQLAGECPHPFSDAEAIAVVREDRRLAQFLKFRIEDRLTQIAQAVEPVVLVYQESRS